MLRECALDAGRDLAREMADPPREFAHLGPHRNRILVLPCSTIIRSTSGFCRLIVISPTVSDRFRAATIAWYFFLFSLKRLSGSINASGCTYFESVAPGDGRSRACGYKARALVRHVRD